MANDFYFIYEIFIESIFTTPTICYDFKPKKKNTP